MTMLNFLIAPDFLPNYVTGWHFVSARLQRLIEQQVHLVLPANTVEEWQNIDDNHADIIYVNPFDATELVRNRGYLPVVTPINYPDETVIATSLDNANVKTLADVKPGMSALYTDNLDIKLIGLRLLEAVDVGENDLNWIHVDSFAMAAHNLIQNKADIGFFMSSVYHSLTEFTRNQLNLLIESRIRDLSHVLLLHPSQAALQSTLQDIFSNFKHESSGQTILNDLGLQDGFEILTQDRLEFMIDLVETLRD